MKDLKVATALVPSRLSSAMGKGRSSTSHKPQDHYYWGQNLRPITVMVNRGEDILDKVSSISQQGLWTGYILSAIGLVHNVSFRKPESSGFVTFEGSFPIVSLSGYIAFTEANGVRCRTGHMNLSITGPDNCVFGGTVSGSLLAASPVQVVVGTSDLKPSRKARKKHVPKPSTSLHASAPNQGAEPASVPHASDSENTMPGHGGASSSAGYPNFPLYDDNCAGLVPQPDDLDHALQEFMVQK